MIAGLFAMHTVPDSTGVSPQVRTKTQGTKYICQDVGIVGVIFRKHA
jgi:hypothetical protein